MTINTLPTAPLRTMSPADFVAAANTFLAALPTFSSQVNADLSALLTLSQLVSTSTTSLTIGTGSKSLTVQTSKAYLANQVVRIYSTATPDNYMDGTVTSYDSGTGALVVNVTATNGSGTLAAWTVILNGGLATTVDLNAAVALRALLAGSVSQAFSVSSLDVGHASDTTLSRSAAGTLAVEGADIITTATVGKRIAQIVTTSTGAVATGTVTIPNDDTIPQNTEGDQYMTLTITPTNINSLLEIDMVGHFATSGISGDNLAMALFQDTTANALSVTAETVNQNFIRCLKLKYTMTAGTTSATTFKMRAGYAQAGTTTFNGAGGGRKYGGAIASSIVIKEYLP